MVPNIGIEPMTYRLSGDYSISELIRHKFFGTACWDRTNFLGASNRCNDHTCSSGVGTSSRIRTYISQLSVATEYKPAVLPLNYRGMVLSTRIELVIHPYQGCVIPLNYESELGRRTGIEPGLNVSQTFVLTFTLFPA